MSLIIYQFYLIRHVFLCCSIPPSMSSCCHLRTFANSVKKLLLCHTTATLISTSLSLPISSLRLLFYLHTCKNTNLRATIDVSGNGPPFLYVFPMCPFLCPCCIFLLKPSSCAFSVLVIILSLSYSCYIYTESYTIFQLYFLVVFHLFLYHLCSL